LLPACIYPFIYAVEKVSDRRLQSTYGNFAFLYSIFFKVKVYFRFKKRFTNEPQGEAVAI
ncbi:hypothetical protein, partial [Klebsiella oxytoca]